MFLILIHDIPQDIVLKIYKTFKIYSLCNFQIYDTVLLTIVEALKVIAAPGLD